MSQAVAIMDNATIKNFNILVLLMHTKTKNGARLNNQSFWAKYMMAMLMPIAIQYPNNLLPGLL
jgi:hypothetical protein